MMSLFSRSLGLFFLATVSLVPISAQISNATVKGTVLDASGATIAGASVELTNTGTAEKRQERTSSQGNYVFSALQPGEYEVKASAQGFADWAGKLTLRVAQEAAVNPTLQAASLTTSVTVNDVNPVITTEVSSLSDVKEAARIESLPLQSRNFLNILNFTPGVVSNSFAGQGQGYTRVNGIPGAQSTTWSTARPPRNATPMSYKGYLRPCRQFRN